MFTNCFSLISLPNIYKWKTDNILYMLSPFFDCLSLSFLPDVSHWKNYRKDDVFHRQGCGFYKLANRFDNLNFEIFNVSDSPGDDIIFNDLKFIGDLKFEKFKRLYNKKSNLSSQK